MGKCVFSTLTLLTCPLLLLLHSAGANLSHPSVLPKGPCYSQQPTKSFCSEITSQVRASHSQITSENGRFVCSVFCRSGEGNPAARPFCLWSLHGKGSYKLGIAPRIIKHISSSYFPAAGGDGARNNSTVQGLWAGEVGWPLTAPEGNMPSNLG